MLLVTDDTLARLTATPCMRQDILLLQETQELRLPLELIDLVEAIERSSTVSRGRPLPEVFLEMRAQLTTATSWAPMVRMAPYIY